jgi:hypothetical protein
VLRTGKPGIGDNLLRFISKIGVGYGYRGKFEGGSHCPPTQYVFYLIIVFLAADLKRDK